MHRSHIVIVTPALAGANNGNWQTAQRWARMLRTGYRVRLTDAWPLQSGIPAQDALMIALHARRSATSVAAWRAARGDAPLIVALTGTDLYRDIASDAYAQASVQTADRLIVLNELGIHSLPIAAHAKAQVVLQSCPSRRSLRKTGNHFRVLMAGHLREEKSPGTYFDAIDLLADRTDFKFDHVGAALDPALAVRAKALMARCPHYRWLGAVPHGRTRARIQAAHVLVHPSLMEGGAHVVIEAIRSGTPVLASKIDGNVGLLGADYDGYFPAGDPEALAALLRRLRDTPAMLARLVHQCALRDELFAPEREAATLHQLVAALLPPGP